MEIAVILGVAGFSTTVAVALLVWALNRLWHRIDRVEVRIDALDAKIDTLDAKMDALRVELEPTNQLLVGLANHRQSARQPHISTSC